VRDATHYEALWNAVREGTIDVLGSDHAPHTREEKDRGYPDTPSGMPGVQTLVPVMLDHVNAGRLSLERFVDLTAHGPQRLFGLARKGRIAVGFDADFTLVDLKARRKIENKWIASRCGWTPFDGVTVTGFPVGTILRGVDVMRDGEVVGSARGAPLDFLETVRPG
jgi:dihydroorotase